MFKIHPHVVRPSSYTASARGGERNDIDEINEQFSQCSHINLEPPGRNIILPNSKSHHVKVILCDFELTEQEKTAVNGSWS